MKFMCLAYEEEAKLNALSASEWDDLRAETIAYVASFDPDRKVPDGIAVVDVDPKSSSYSKIINTVAMPNAGDELHHFGWNACSSCLCPNAPHPHVERRYLVVPGLRSSRIYILDTKPDPRAPKIVIAPAMRKPRSGRKTMA